MDGQIRINLTWKSGAGMEGSRGDIKETVSQEQLSAILAVIHQWPIVITAAPKELPCTPR